MRGLLNSLGALVLVASTALGQTLPIEDREVTNRWIKIQTMATGEDDAGGIDHLISHGMSSEGAAKLQAFVQQATTAFNNWASDYSNRVCSHAADLRAGGQEALAQFYEKDRAESAALRRGYLDGALALLTDADKERLDHLLTNAEHGPKLYIPDQPDTVTLARTGGLTVDSVLKRHHCETNEGVQK